MEHTKRKNSRLNTVLLVLLFLLLVAALVFGSYTYSKYVTQKTASGTAQVAKFGVNITADASELFGKNSEWNSEKSRSTITTDENGLTVKASGDYNVIAPGTTGELKFKVSGKSEVKCKVTVRIDNTPTELWDVSLLVQKELDQRKINEYYPLDWNFMFKSTTSGSTYTLEANALNMLPIRTYDGGSTINDLEYIFEPGEEINEVFALWWSWDFERNAASFRGRNSPLYNLGFTANECDTIFGYAINSGMTPEEWGGAQILSPTNFPSGVLRAGYNYYMNPFVKFNITVKVEQLPE